MHNQDQNSTGLNVLSFFIPIIGLVLYLTYKSDQPIKASGVGKWALIGFGIGVLGVLVGA